MTWLIYIHVLVVPVLSNTCLEQALDLVLLKKGFTDHIFLNFYSDPNLIGRFFGLLNLTKTVICGKFDKLI